MEKHQKHLDLLAIFHYIVAVLVALVSCLPLIHFAMGVMMILSPETFRENADPATDFPAQIAGWIIAAIAAAFILLGWATAVLIGMTGRFLQLRKHRVFCIVVAAIECLFMPFGTVLGIFTLIILLQSEVEAMFNGQQPTASEQQLE